MSEKSASATATIHGNAGLFALAMLSLLAGAVTGVVGAGFRIALERAEGWRDSLLQLAHSYGALGLLLAICAAAGATALAAWMVRRIAPEASGSGIPHVEAVLRGRVPPAALLLVPVKFLGGLLAIGIGLALGREGPSVQMGATLSHFIGRLFRRDQLECRSLLAGGAGAGLATAFNAPIGGAIFVLEEMVRRFDTRITVVTFGSSVGAIATARLLLGTSPDFRVPAIPYSDIRGLPIFLALGLFAGLLGVAYNRAILGAMSLMSRLDAWPIELRAAVIGGGVGLLAWYLPNLVGGGDALTQGTLTTTPVLPALLLGLLIRFALGPISYAARTPGGLFAPMLALGAQIGLLTALAREQFLTGLGVDSASLAVVGMAAFFTAVVRAPLTGIVLVIEMTGSFTLLFPMLEACLVAMLVPTLLRDPPIYDSLGVAPRYNHRR
jgi:CIC family chloride channel protein